MRAIRTVLFFLSMTLLLTGCQSQMARLDCSPQQLVIESVEKGEMLMGLLEDAWWLAWNLSVNLDRLSARTSPQSH